MHHDCSHDCSHTILAIAERIHSRRTSRTSCGADRVAPRRVDAGGRLGPLHPVRICPVNGVIRGAVDVRLGLIWVLHGRRGEMRPRRPRRLGAEREGRMRPSFCERHRQTRTCGDARRSPTLAGLRAWLCAKAIRPTLRRAPIAYRSRHRWPSCLRAFSSLRLTMHAPFLNSPVI